MDLKKIAAQSSAGADADKKREEAERRAELAALQPIKFEELEAEVRKWMLVADTGIIKLLPALIVANRLKGHDPVWAFLIGPSGGGKTEFLNSLFELSDVYPVSLLTPNTFLSGMPGKNDSSLLPQVDGKILIFKDWTNILSQNKDARNEIMGQLREIYDGHMKKPFGTGVVREWKGKIGLIAGVTGAVDMAQQMNSTLGERFIQYRLLMPDREEVAWRALNNGNNQSEMRHALRNAFFAFMKAIEMPETMPDIPEEVKKEIVAVANFSTMARSGVIREFSFKKEVIFVPAAEMPTRIVQQLSTVATAFVIVNKGEYSAEDMKTIYRIALDCIPQTNYMVMKAMARGDERTTAEIATDIGYPTGPIRMYLENLALLGVCRRIKAADSEEGGTADKWTLEPKFSDILRRYENIKLVEQEKLEEMDQVLKEAEELKAAEETKDASLFDEAATE